MNWNNCKNILIIRPDNMGDLLMSSPAIRAIKETFGCRITVLTSSMGQAAAELIPEIDEVMVINLPWLKLAETENPEQFFGIVERLKVGNFDGCLLFNVFSQNPAPCMMLAFLAGIPLRAAYARENLYALLSHWLIDEEPYFYIRHQVERDLALAEFIGATTADRAIKISVKTDFEQLAHRLEDLKVVRQGYFIFHIAVSEEKRKYPVREWVALGKMVLETYKLPVFFTGSAGDEPLIQLVQSKLLRSHNLAGRLNVNELACLIENAKAMVAVNTGPVHLAAALQTPVVVLYAKTNPQHHPWMAKSKVLGFEVDAKLRSANQVLKYVNERVDVDIPDFPDADCVFKALGELLP